MSRTESLKQGLEREWHNQHADAQQAGGLWRDAEEKIAAGLITRKDAERHMPKL